MANYTAPGVYVKEGPLLTLTPPSSAVSVAAFFGESNRGPTDPVLVQDWSSYRRFFGDLDTRFDLGYAVYHYFTNGGRAAWVTRVVSGDATLSSAASVPFFPTGINAASSSLFSVVAAGEGAWGNDLSIQVRQGNILPEDDELPTFGITVRYLGREVERWLEVSMDPTRNRFAPLLINRSSSFIRIENVSTASPSADMTFPPTVTVLSGGSDSPPSNADYIGALDKLDDIDASLLINMVGKTSQNVIQAALNKAGERGDSFVIIDPAKSDSDIVDVEATVASYLGLQNNSYGAVYVPMVMMVDPTKSGIGSIRETFPGGAIAGLYARTEVERNVAKSPAGYTSDLRGAFGLKYPINDTDTGTLYSGNPPVNCLKAVPGGGIIVNGARTLSKRDSAMYINVRRTLNFLKRRMKQLTEYAVFENNDYPLWTSITSTLTGFLDDFWAAGGLKGRSAQEAFRVVCDETNNPQATIDQGILNVEVAVALLYPAEFIVIEISQWAGGASTTERS